ncbi:MAG: hypothetical protein ACRDJ1_02510 [Actinomycetota bacterium]
MSELGGKDGALSRRRLLFLGAAGTLGVVFARILDPFKGSEAPGLQAHGPTHTPTPEPSEGESPSNATVRGAVLTRWSDPATWNGKLPGPGDIAKINSPVLLDMDPSVGGVEIGPAGSLTFDPNKSHTLTSKGNVIVRGRLTMRPSTASILHKILITGSKESAFKGGGAIPLATDTGLWVTAGGVFDAIGSAKRGWIRAAGSIARGKASVTLAETPSGWRAGDEVVLTPTRSPASGPPDTAYDTATIKSISGRTITLSKKTSFDHPAVAVGNGKTFTAEVLNLTRNVRVEGKPGARIHVFLNSSKKQTIKHIGIRYAGPRQGGNVVLGRYGLHFHMVGSHSRGSLVEGVVVRDTGSHSFVPHASDGITVRDCVAHNVVNAAYWWDPLHGNETKDLTYDRCVASLVRAEGGGEFRLPGFWLGHGDGNTTVGCVAVGVGGSKNASGFNWPESPGSREDGTVWGFRDNVAHNNKVDGIFTWQNNLGPSVIDRFVAYHNGKAGIEHGAYKNVYQYKNSILYGNGTAAVIIHAVAGQSNPTMSFKNLLCDGAGRSNYVVLFERHTAPPAKHTQIVGCTLKGYKKAAFGLLDNSAKQPDNVDVVDCTFAGNEFWLANDVDPETLIRVQDPKHGALALRRADQPGTFYPQWNARVSQISKFV